MKNINMMKYLTIALVFLISFSSCSEEYLEISNPNELALSSFYKTPQDAQYAVNICYTPAMHQGLFGRNWFLIFNTWSDRILFETTGLDYFNVNSGWGQSQQMYRDCYRMLWRSSHVLHNIELSRDVMGLDEETYNLHTGQLKAIQGMSYFFLVTLFKQPNFYDENSLPEDANELFTNSDPVLFWDGLESSLEYAIEHLPESWPPADYGRITSGAAKALLGKALVWKYYHYYKQYGITDGMAEDLAYAKELLNDVMTSGTYSLVQPLDPANQLDVVNAYQCNFAYVDLPDSEGGTYKSENNTESVWEIQYSSERNSNQYLPGWLSTGNMQGQYYSPHDESFKNHEAHPNLYYAFDEVTGHPAGFDRDPRVYGTLYMDGDLMDFRDPTADAPYYKYGYTTNIQNKNIASGRGLAIPGQPSGSFGLKKYHYPVYAEPPAPQSCPVNIRYIRLSDVMLLYAEACMLSGSNDADGMAAINEVRARVGMPAIDGPITPEMIMHERELELALEGHRYLDLIRWSFDPELFTIDWVDLYDGLDIFTPGRNEFLPIPLSEINVNDGAMEQNPGW